MKYLRVQFFKQFTSHHHVFKSKLCSNRTYCQYVSSQLHTRTLKRSKLHIPLDVQRIEKRLRSVLASFRQSHFSSPHITESNENDGRATRRNISRRARSPAGGPLGTGDNITAEPAAGSASKDGFTLSRADGSVVVIPWIWLRDHCRCGRCYNSTTFQKNVDSYLLSGDVQDCRIEGDKLVITWLDGHVSDLSLQWVQDNFYNTSNAKHFLWDKMKMNESLLPSVPFDLHMKTEDGLQSTLQNIIRYGFCLVHGAPPTEEGTDLVATRICFMQETFYGRMNLMVSDVYSHADTAYTSLALGAHTDTTYLTVPAGIQVFHCIHHDGEGGETLLVDGFLCAEKLRQKNPSAFDMLSNVVVAHEYRDGKKHHFHSLGPVLSLDSVSGCLTQIRFNPYDRATLCTVAPADIGKFYQHYSALSSIVRSSDNEFWLKLRPGNVLLVDNWRVMHGRSAFTGKRVVSGCYLPRDDWISKARVMRLL